MFKRFLNLIGAVILPYWNIRIYTFRAFYWALYFYQGSETCFLKWKLLRFLAEWICDHEITHFVFSNPSLLDRITVAMEALSVQEKIEMILIYGESDRNIDDAVNLYAERFPDRVRSRASFYRVVRQFTTDGSVQLKKRTVGEQLLELIMKLRY